MCVQTKTIKTKDRKPCKRQVGQKKMPKQSKMRQNAYQNGWVHFVLAISCLT